MMVPVGRLTLVRSFPKSPAHPGHELRGIPSLVGPMLGPTCGRFDRPLSPLARDLLPQRADRADRPGAFLYETSGLSRAAPNRSISRGLILFGVWSRAPLLCLEVFGDHSLSAPRVFGFVFVSLALLLLVTVCMRSAYAGRSCGSACSAAAPSRRRSAAVSSRGSASAACPSCCRFSIRWVSASRLCNPACSSCRRPSPR